MQLLTASSLCSRLVLDPTIVGMQLGGFDADPPCAPPPRRGSSGVPKSREPGGFRVPTGGRTDFSLLTEMIGSQVVVSTFTCARRASIFSFLDVTLALTFSNVNKISKLW